MLIALYTHYFFPCMYGCMIIIHHGNIDINLAFLYKPTCNECAHTVIFFHFTTNASDSHCCLHFVLNFVTLLFEYNHVYLNNLLHNVIKNFFDKGMICELTLHAWPVDVMCTYWTKMEWTYSNCTCKLQSPSWFPGWHVGLTMMTASCDWFSRKTTPSTSLAERRVCLSADNLYRLLKKLK